MPQPVPHFALAVLSVPLVKEGIEGGVRLIKLLAIVQKVHDDQSADLTVFLSEETGAKDSPIRFLEKVTFDKTGSSAISYGPLHSEEPKAEVPALPARPKDDGILHNQYEMDHLLGMYSGMPGGRRANPSAPGPAVVPSPSGGGQSRVFGRGKGKSTSMKSGQVFRNADQAMARGDINESSLARMGPPRAAIPGQLPPRVFMKTPKGGQKEITPPGARTKPDLEGQEQDELDSILSEASDGEILFDPAAEQNGTTHIMAPRVDDMAKSGGGTPL
jgi:hypothetical protein